MTKKPMSEAELLALPMTVDMATAGRAFGMGRTKAYEMARAGDFPCPVLPLGRRFVVTKAALLKAHGIDWAPQGGERSAA
jgi:predicted DNA-binding transcriptional regulator AlpA